jgi:hypothetical protein
VTNAEGRRPEWAPERSAPFSLSRPSAQSTAGAEDSRRRADSGPGAATPAVHDLVAIHFVLLRAAQFANPKNPHCFPMATLQAGKLANSLMPNTSHFSLGSANKINKLLRQFHSIFILVPNSCPISVGERWRTIAGVPVKQKAGKIGKASERSVATRCSTQSR